MVARLVDLAVIYGEGSRARPVIVPITQDDLAGMAGTTRPTTNQVLQRLADEGVLALGRGRIELIDARVAADQGRGMGLLLTDAAHLTGSLGERFP